MKIGEKYIDADGSKFVIQTTYDFNPVLDRAATLRSIGDGRVGESRHVATLPLALIREWCKEAGVAWSDIEGRKEVVKRKLMDRDFSQFRVWGGSY
jgi:hypothetical protein